MKWTLKVKNFGKIRDAEVHDSSIRFIVGENNSGKSYLMTLLWGMGKITDYTFEYLGEGLPEFDLSSWISEEQIDSLEKNGGYTFKFKDYEELINGYVNLLLHNAKDRFMQGLFNYSDITVGDLSLQLSFDENDTFVIKDFISFDNFILTIDKTTHGYMGMGEETVSKQRLKILFFAVDALLDYLFQDELASTHKIYFPAARTGYMLTKDIINKAGRRVAFSNDAARYEPFTLPTIEFLDLINEFLAYKKTDEGYEKICAFIEEEIIHGTIIINDLPNKPVTFLPKGSDAPLPMRMASAVVTEIAPLYLALKYKTEYEKIGSVFYEEPEMCLHLSLQQKIARVLIKLANAGVKLTVTTHSDIIIQHVNNMLSLEHNKQRENLMEELDYSPDDLLNNLNIAMYQFNENEDGTMSLAEIKCKDYGFAVPTFNNALDRLTNEVYTVQEDEE